MKIKVQNKIIWGLIATLVLVIDFLIIRYALFELHFMHQWPLILFIFGILVVGISTVVGTWKVMIGTVVGYVLGFVLGMVIFADVGRFDPNRGHYVYYGWWIWLLSYLAFIVTGIIWELIDKKRSKSKMK
jgi:hypothetical membrane protein